MELIPELDPISPMEPISLVELIPVLEPIPIVEPLPVIIDMIPQVPILIPSYPHLSTRHAQLRVRIGL